MGPEWFGQHGSRFETSMSKLYLERCQVHSFWPHLRSLTLFGVARAARQQEARSWHGRAHDQMDRSIIIVLFNGTSDNMKSFADSLFRVYFKRCARAIFNASSRDIERQMGRKLCFAHHIILSWFNDSLKGRFIRSACNSTGKSWVFLARLVRDPNDECSHHLFSRCLLLFFFFLSLWLTFAAYEIWIPPCESYGWPNFSP